MILALKSCTFSFLGSEFCPNIEYLQVHKETFFTTLLHLIRFALKRCYKSFSLKKKKWRKEQTLFSFFVWMMPHKSHSNRIQQPSMPSYIIHLPALKHEMILMYTYLLNSDIYHCMYWVWNFCWKFRTLTPSSHYTFNIHMHVITTNCKRNIFKT